MSDPEVVTALREFKRQLLGREEAQMQEMARRWLQIERALQGEIDLLAQRLASEPTRGLVFRIDRLKRLAVQVEDQFNRYIAYCNGKMIEYQTEMARLGIDHGYRALELTAGRLGYTFDRLPVEAIENMIGLTSNGRPVGDLLRKRMIMDDAGRPLPGVLDKLQQTMIDATAQGWNPVKTARAMRNDIAGGFQKALTITRTEQLRVYREANRMQYQASGIVVGHKRLTAHDGRVCAACLADEGTVYPVGMNIPDHPRGRCTSIPVLAGEAEPQWTGGETWLEKQSEKRQREILGPGHYDAWKAGTPLSAMLVRTTNETWGDGVQVAPLKGLA